MADYGISLAPEVLAQLAAASFRPPPPAMMPSMQAPPPPMIQMGPGGGDSTGGALGAGLGALGMALPFLPGLFGGSAKAGEVTPKGDPTGGAGPDFLGGSTGLVSGAAPTTGNGQGGLSGTDLLKMMWMGRYGNPFMFGGWGS